MSGKLYNMKACSDAGGRSLTTNIQTRTELSIAKVDHKHGEEEVHGQAHKVNPSRLKERRYRETEPKPGSVSVR